MENEKVKIGDYVCYSTKHGDKVQQVVRITDGVPVLKNDYVCPEGCYEKVDVRTAIIIDMKKVLSKYDVENVYGTLECIVGKESQFFKAEDLLTK